MKSKIHCHFDKINKFFHSDQFFDDVIPLNIVAVVIFSTVFCMLLSPIIASAYSYSVYPITLSFGNLDNVPYERINIVTSNGELGDMGTITVTSPLTYENGNFYVAEFYTLDGQQYCLFDGIDIPLDYQVSIPDGSYYICAYAIVVSGEHAFFTNVGSSTGTAGGLVDSLGLFVHFELNTGNAFTLINRSYHTGDYEHMTVILTPIDTGGGTPTQCPTLEEQISNYNGSWTDFLMMLRQNNPTLANSYQNNIDLAIQSGFQSGANSVTLEQRLSEFNGDWQDFERLMAEYNVDLQTMYTSYVNTLETQAFEDGRVFGNDEGYKNGYLSGLNKGQSDNALKGFFGNFIGGVIDVVDSIHFYEEFDSNGNLTFYLSPWSIVIVVLMVAIVIIFLKVFRGG